MKVKKSRLINILIFLMLAALNPGYSPGAIGTIFGLFRTIAFVVSCCVFLQNKLFNNKDYLALISILVWMGIATFLYNNGLSGYAFTFRQFFSMVTLSFYCLKKKPKFYIRSMALIFSFLLIVDGLTWTSTGLYQNDGRTYFFLGTGTTITYYLFIGLAFDFIYIQIAKEKEKTFSKFLFFSTLLASMWYVFNQKVSTAILCLVLLPILYVITFEWKSINRIVLNYGFLITLIVNALIVLLPTFVNLFSNIIVNFLGENLELNGRRAIWNMVLEYISKRWLIGYGYSSNIRFDAYTTYNTSTHNFYLYLLFSTGIIGLFIFLGIIYRLHNKQKQYYNEAVCKIIILTLIIMNIVSISENGSFRVMYFALLSTFACLEYILPLTNCRYLQK